MNPLEGKLTFTTGSMRTVAPHGRIVTKALDVNGCAVAYRAGRRGAWRYAMNGAAIEPVEARRLDKLLRDFQAASPQPIVSAGVKRASYRSGVAWIAMNDDSGSPDATDETVVAGYISTCLLADLFGVTQERVARDVVRYRRNQ